MIDCSYDFHLIFDQNYLTVNRMLLNGAKDILDSFRTEKIQFLIKILHFNEILEVQ